MVKDATGRDVKAGDLIIMHDRSLSSSGFNLPYCLGLVLKAHPRSGALTVETIKPLSHQAKTRILLGREVLLLGVNSDFPRPIISEKKSTKLVISHRSPAKATARESVDTLGNPLKEGQLAYCWSTPTMGNSIIGIGYIQELFPGKGTIILRVQEDTLVGNKKNVLIIPRLGLNSEWELALHAFPENARVWKLPK